MNEPLREVQKRRAIAAEMVRQRVLRVRRRWALARHVSHSRLVWCGSQWCPYVAEYAALTQETPDE